MSFGFGSKSVVGEFGPVLSTRWFISYEKLPPATTECSTVPVLNRDVRSVWLSQMSSCAIHERISRLIAVELLFANLGGDAIESRREYPYRNWLRNVRRSLKSCSTRAVNRSDRSRSWSRSANP